MEPILIYADPESSAKQAANVFNPCRMHKSQPVLVLNNTSSERSERNGDLSPVCGQIQPIPNLVTAITDETCATALA